ncbi:arylesterase [Thiomicrorhabdus aquaedulcis]|uniref:arylesterase n=1 Tax=Thiomicrorhabdus aquaedulcis TaxID=2211106 RepID=UPI000FD73B00|nr:arylesterase [Thiomicrorhabdus aquaedulcis]
MGVMGIGQAFYPSVSFAQLQAVSASSVTHRAPTVLLMGDSLSAAYGLDVAQGWGNLLQQKLLSASATNKKSVNVVNASISGETTSGGKARLEALMQAHKPSVLVLELGANDALRGQSLAATEQNLHSMMALCAPTRFNCQVVLLGVKLPTNYGPAYDNEFKNMYARLAQTFKLPVGERFDAFFLEPVALDPTLMQADGLHPNAAAQPIILARVWPLIEHALHAAFKAVPR